MTFTNPFELLELDSDDKEAIKKAKRRKLAEFELSDDGTIEVGTQKVIKSDFIRVTDELDNPDKVEFYLFVKGNPRLNAFLTMGDTSFFTNYRQESIFSDADFINFISPYFAEQYNKVLLQAFNEDNLPLLKKIVANPPLVNGLHLDKSYRGLSQLLKSIEEGLHEIRTEIDNEESYYDEDTVGELEVDLREKANNDAINILPSYFQSQRNEIAQKVRNISVAVFNGINDAEASFRIVSYSLEFNVNNLTKQKLQKDYEQLKEIYENRKESEQFSPELAKYAGALLQIVQMIKQVETNQILTSSIQSKVNSLFSVSELNQLPNVFDEIREQLALAIRGLSVAVWNEKSDIDVAIGLIQIAQKINLKSDIKNQITKAYTELSELRDKQVEPILTVLQGMIKTIRQVNATYGQTINSGKVQEVLNDVFKPQVIQAIANTGASSRHKIVDELRQVLAILPSYFVNGFVDKISSWGSGDSGLTTKIQSMKKSGSTSSPTSNPTSDDSNSGCMVLMIIGGVIALFAWLFNSNNSSSSSSYNSSSYTSPSSNNSSPSNTYTSPTSSNSSTIPPSEPIKESKYIGNKLPNGTSPLDACFGKGKYGGDAWILFKNSNSSDAIVCLVKVNSGKTIRNEYIRAGSNFKMTKIPSGTYYLKTFYGNDWNPKLKNVCGTKGSFESNVHFSKSDDRSDWIEVENSAYSYTTGEITLYTVAGGNMSQMSIDESAFFNN